MVSNKISKHRILPGTIEADNEDDILNLQRNASKRARIDAIPRSQVQQLGELATAFIVDDDQSFSVFSNVYLQEMFGRFDRQLLGHMAWGRTHQRQQLQYAFKTKKEVIRRELETAFSTIHLSFDLWTSPNRYAFMAVVAHFINKSGLQQSRLLALQQQQGAHSGQNIAANLSGIVNDWGIDISRSTLISDNAFNNDTCLYHFFDGLGLDMTSEDIKMRRMRCFGHILNLVARAFLYGTNADSFESQSQAFEILQDYEADLQHWRKRGPVGKLHNIVRYIRSSPQRAQAFKHIAKEAEEEGGYQLSNSTAELELISDNDTRWNSTYLMIERAIRKKNDIIAFLALDQSGGPSGGLSLEDRLEPQDWQLLSEVMHILKPIYDLTMRTQGSRGGGDYGRLWEVLVGFEYLLEDLEHWRELYEPVTLETVTESFSQRPPTPTEIAPGSSPPVRRLRDRSNRRRPRQAFDLSFLPAHARCDYQRAREVSQINGIEPDFRNFIISSIDNAWSKLNEYYTKLEDSPLWAAAVVLYPAFNLQWLEEQWQSETQVLWIHKAKKGLQNYFDYWYPDTQAEEISTPPGLSIKPEQSYYDQWIKSRQKKVSSGLGELERYYRLGSQDTTDPVGWWVSQKSSFPRLSQLALDILAIPAMAADTERTFSAAKLALTSQRHSMKPETLEQLQCLRNWVRGGAIQMGGIIRPGQTNANGQGGL